MNRRKLLKQLTLGSSIVAGASLPYGLARMLAPEQQQSSRNSTLKPPGALVDDLTFIEACIGCGLCGEVCPPGCIAFNKREGGSAVNTPYIDPEIKACTLCGKCMDACPTEALTRVELDEIDMGIAQIDRSACYPWVDNGICGACVVICPMGGKAIDFDFANIYRPVVKQGCVGCGLCVEVCPHPSLPIKIVQRSEAKVVKPVV